ncbi:hypothetical protein DSCW_53460 [Desulfosarcina widdelii]|uniref:AMP-activated protein kinase glycogen-binding domain-containing protein n=1 Tax=Desulfosarcina widdelii TaxID=947919 RepID=A0A5K7ZCM4_9BACT|nr:isoamylase early set domain-containing protein [Desulfosarcina widdelii]BBO77929.1 hypothetical protein DSCW_53460 [Desulfosarcina widdelii]
MDKTNKQKNKRRKITFTLEDIEAKEVHLVGNFNDWNVGAHPMKNVGNGKWRKQLALPTGKYEYKFMVDGYWMVDPANEQTCPNCFGTYNSIVSLIV